MMKSEPIRIFFVDADPGAGTDLQDYLAKIEGIEIVGVARNKKTALEAVETTTAQVMLVDVMLTGYRSMDVISHVVAVRPDIHCLAVTAGDPNYERVILAMKAGAQGYITHADNASEVLDAITSVNQGRSWLPAEATAEILRDAAQELTVTVEDRRGRLVQMLLGVLPLTGLIAAFTALLWRKYWGDVGIRVTDLGVDASTRVIDVIVFLITLIGIFGPLIFVEAWVSALSTWIKKRSWLQAKIERVRQFRLAGIPVGHLLLSHNAAWLGLALVTVFLTNLLYQFSSLILVLVVGIGTAILLLANYLGLGEELPKLLRVSSVNLGRIFVIMSILMIFFLVVLSAEVLLEGPDLRTDGVHGILAPKVLGFSAKPARLHNLDGQFDPIEALYIGGNADLYVLYDPCEEVTRMVPVGSSRVEIIDQVTCR
jgi:DNA-binding NarL/FixJ family response regulator